MRCLDSLKESISLRLWKSRKHIPFCDGEPLVCVRMRRSFCSHMRRHLAIHICSRIRRIRTRLPHTFLSVSRKPIIFVSSPCILNALIFLTSPDHILPEDLLLCNMGNCLSQDTSASRLPLHVNMMIMRR